MFKINSTIQKKTENATITPLLSRSGVVLSFTLLFIFFTACSSDDNYNYPAPEEVAGFMAFNLITDQPTVGVALSGNQVGPPLQYRNFTGGYLRIYPGKRSTDAYAGRNGNTLSTTTYTYDPENYYSLFMIGTEDHYENVIVRDNLDTLQAGNETSYLRYINAIPNQENPDIEISQDSLNLYTGTAAYGAVSPFMKSATGEVSITIKNNEKIDTSRTIRLENDKVYTLLLTGDPDARGSAPESVQIRYIENGLLTQDSIADDNARKTE